jgi:3-hydroxymyristoyl/3-hydroxydecanoyl-(acyl carrier protein) dehydratase
MNETVLEPPAAAVHAVTPARPVTPARDLPESLSLKTGPAPQTNISFALEEWQIRLILPHRPPVLQLDRVERCVPALGLLEASKAVTGGDSMLARDGAGPPRLSAAALIEGLAQCSGLLLRLRWLEAAGVDLLAFAAGDSSQLDNREIPRSVLAESQVRFMAPAQPGRVLRLATRLVLSRGDMHRFNASAHGATEAVTAQIMLGFPNLG